ncbi:MAG: RidA family protein [Synergistaceae bacterium]|jgi:2-iminobutanoate/2-iminopropanoate deaminase|nr:RidA family protein [Synergistaceae bacterium]
MKEIVNTDKAPAAIGPYSQATKIGGFLFLSGQIPLDPNTMEVVPGCIACQVEQVMKNTKNILESQGLDFSDVVKTTVFIKDMNDFSRVNDVYAKYFNQNPPARSCIEVARLPKDVLVEMECIAALR